jgi:hypothetical protein
MYGERAWGWSRWIGARGGEGCVTIFTRSGRDERILGQTFIEHRIVGSGSAGADGGDDVDRGRGNVVGRVVGCGFFTTRQRGAIHRSCVVSRD